MEAICELNIQIEEDFNFAKRVIESCNKKLHLQAAKRLIFLFYDKHKSQYYRNRLNNYLRRKSNEFIWF